MMDLGEDRVAALCSHNYCGKCMVTYLKSQNGVMSKCPYCRRYITFIVAADSGKIAHSDIDYIRNYNKVNSDSRSFLDALFDTPYLLSEFKKELI
mmetsp:Transcript_95642/g.131527  ORF Transcript_95642/g.131527 Transcript_95642/m.131527 type:complete len:95 (+) Transcript_95642:213-497(+)